MRGKRLERTVFFFQAEDGIRDDLVTGVQTCALPIYIFIPKIPNVEPLAAELGHFVRVARGAEPPRSSAEDGVRVVRVLAAATRSLAAGGAPGAPLTPPPPPPPPPPRPPAPNPPAPPAPPGACPAGP